LVLSAPFQHRGDQNCSSRRAGIGEAEDAEPNNPKAEPEARAFAESRQQIDTYRQLGNFSAHRIEYICRREYIQPHIQDYRALIVERLDKAGIRI
jgi:hypothetical protein